MYAVGTTFLEHTGSFFPRIYGSRKRVVHCTDQWVVVQHSSRSGSVFDFASFFSNEHMHNALDEYVIGDPGIQTAPVPAVQETAEERERRVAMIEWVDIVSSMNTPEEEEQTPAQERDNAVLGRMVGTTRGITSADLVTLLPDVPIVPSEDNEQERDGTIEALFASPRDFNNPRLPLTPGLEALIESFDRSEQERRQDSDAAWPENAVEAAINAHERMTPEQRIELDLANLQANSAIQRRNEEQREEQREARRAARRSNHSAWPHVSPVASTERVAAARREQSIVEGLLRENLDNSEIRAAREETRRRDRETMRLRNEERIQREREEARQERQREQQEAREEAQREALEREEAQAAQEQEELDRQRELRVDVKDLDPANRKIRI